MRTRPLRLDDGEHLAPDDLVARVRVEGRVAAQEVTERAALDLEKLAPFETKIFFSGTSKLSRLSGSHSRKW